MKPAPRKPVAFCGARSKIRSQEPDQRPPPYQGALPMQLNAEQLRAFDEQGYVFFPNCFSEEEIALLRVEAENILKLDRQEVWREKSGAPRTAFAAHTFSEVFGLLGAPPAPDRTVAAIVRRGSLRPPVQAQRQGRLRGRRLAMAPGLRHLAARRRHAAGARHEHRGVPRRGDADQRPAAADSEKSQTGRVRRRPRQAHHVLSVVDARQGDGDAARRARPPAPTASASSRPPASPARC